MGNEAIVATVTNHTGIIMAMSVIMADCTEYITDHDYLGQIINQHS